MTETMEMSPLERAARAAADAAEWDYDDVPFLTESIVRAVLQAIREPSQKMLGAGEYDDCGAPGEGVWFGGHLLERSWTAMIDAALAE